MDALHEGADPTVAARLSGKPLVSIEGREKYRFVTWEVALATWSKVSDTLGLSAEVGKKPQDEGGVLQVRFCSAVFQHLVCIVRRRAKQQEDVFVA